MAILDITGFEVGDAAAESSTLTGTASIQSSVVRTGTYALRTNPTTTGTGYLTWTGNRNLDGALNGAFLASFSRYARFYFRYATKPSSNYEIMASVAGLVGKGAQVGSLIVTIDSSGVLSLYKSSTAAGAGTFTFLAAGSTALSANTWYRIEIRRDSGTTGSIAYGLLIDGVTELSGTTSWNKNTGTSLLLGKPLDKNGNTVDFYYDDVAMSDSSYPGPGQGVLLTANANGNYQTWSIGAGSGSHYQVVDDIPNNGDTDYLLSTIVLNDSETVGVVDTSTAGITGTILAVKSLLAVKRDGASAGLLKLRLRSGSTDSDTSSNFINSQTAYGYIGHLYATDPNTSSAWTLSGVDNVEIGLIERSNTARSRLTAAALYVDYQPSSGLGFFRSFNIGGLRSGGNGLRIPCQLAGGLS